MLFFRKSDEIFNLIDTKDFGKSLEMASGEYRNRNLVMVTKVSNLTITSDLDSYVDPIIFATSDFTTAIWAQRLPFTIPSNGYIMADLTSLNPEHLIVSFPHESSYVEYCGSEIFLRGEADLAVVLLNSTTGECSAITTIGKSGEGFYLGNVVIGQEENFVINGYRGIEGTLFVNQLTVDGTVYICEHGRNYKGKCLCEEGYFGNHCEIHCNKDCGEHGKCHINITDPICLCEDGYFGGNCDKLIDFETSSVPTPTPTPSHESGSDSGSSKLAPKPTPQPTPTPTPCNCSEICQGSGVTEVKPLYFLLALISILTIML